MEKLIKPQEGAQQQNNVKISQPISNVITSPMPTHQASRSDYINTHDQMMPPQQQQQNTMNNMGLAGMPQMGMEQPQQMPQEPIGLLIQWVDLVLGNLYN